MLRKIQLTLAVLALLASPILSPAVAAPKTVLVIVSKKLSVTAISLETLRLVFQAQVKTWPDGTTAVPFNLPPENALRHDFDSVVLGLEPYLVARYWIDRRVRDGDRPPLRAPSPALMVRVVSSLVGAVGYVEEGTEDASVKAIAKIVNGKVVAP